MENIIKRAEIAQQIINLKEANSDIEISHYDDLEKQLLFINKSGLLNEADNLDNDLNENAVYSLKIDNEYYLYNRINMGNFYPISKLQAIKMLYNEYDKKVFLGRLYSENSF
jgi:hypothetical protein